MYCRQMFDSFSNKTIRLRFSEGRPHISQLSVCQGPSFPSRPQHIKKSYISTRSEAALKPSVCYNNKPERKKRGKMRPLLLWKLKTLVAAVDRKICFQLPPWRREGVSVLFHYRCLRRWATYHLYSLHHCWVWPRMAIGNPRNGRPLATTWLLKGDN